MEGHFHATNIEMRLEKLRQGGPAMTDASFQAEHERISRDVDDAMRAGIKAVRRKNVGYARSPTLTRAASIVRYWRTQLRARRNALPLSRASLDFAAQHSLPLIVEQLPVIFKQLHQAWAALREVQRRIFERRGWRNWLIRRPRRTTLVRKRPLNKSSRSIGFANYSAN